MANTFLNIPNNGSPSWKDPVQAVVNLPTVGNTLGDARIVTSTNTPYVWSGSTWVAAGGGGGGITALTGDGTASGTGSVPLTLATVNSTVGTFGTAASTPTVTVNAKGLVTAASNTSILIAQSQVTDLVSDLAGKQNVGNYITALTGDVTASGPGSVTATIPNNAVTNAKLAQAPTLTIKGNNTGSTANVSDLTVSQVNTMLTVAEFNAGTLGATPTIDFANGPAQRGTLSANATITLTGANSGGAYVIRLIQDTTPRTVTWPASVRWPGGTAPVISTGSGAIDVINLYFDGTNYYGSFAQAYA